jgi:hypothetical protein
MGLNFFLVFYLYFAFLNTEKFCGRVLLLSFTRDIYIMALYSDNFY